jgi:cobalt-zinc-cadmium efflux system outer membrane protein
LEHRENVSISTAFLVAATLAVTAPARAEGPGCATVSRQNVAACVVGASADLVTQREARAAAEGRLVAAEPWFPSNPLLSVSAGRRNGSDASATNVWATLSQEIEIAGQRAARRRAADAEIDARTADVVASTRRVAAAAYRAYYRAIAAREAALVARRLEATGADVARVTRARAEAGVASTVDAEVAEAAALRLAQERVDASMQERVAVATLATLLGRDPVRETIAIEGALEPLPGADALVPRANAQMAKGRPEVRALKKEESAHASRAEAFRRARFPTLTIQVFAQNDGFDEKVLGAGLALPLPLPQPLGRTFAGEAAEEGALARQAASRAAAAERELANDLAVAVAAYDAARAQVALYGDDRAARAERILSDIAKEIEAGRLATRDAVLAQRELTDVLRGRVDALRALSLASVDLVLAAGAPLEGAR